MEMSRASERINIEKASVLAIIINALQILLVASIALYLFFTPQAVQQMSLTRWALLFAAALVCEVEIESNAAAAVEELIAAIGDVTLAKAEQITAAAEAVAALTEGELVTVDNLDTLIAAVEELVELALEVDDVIAAIEDLPEDADKESVLAVKAAYDELNDEQKTFVTNYDKLAAALDAIKAPQTGDMTPVALLSAMMMLSMLAAAALVLYTKKQKA